MRFLNPRTDFAFKRIFGSGASRDVLVSFLNAVLELDGAERIVEVTLLDPYQAPRIKGWKDTFVDVKARDQAGRTFIVEMQVLIVAALEKRILYNACKAYVDQIKKGEDYRKLVGVIAITITDFVMYPKLAGIVSTFRLRAEENPDIVQQDMALVFVELPKFTKTEDQLTSPLERWLYFLKSAESLDAIPAPLAADPAIEHAFEIANRAGLSEDELDDLERREQWYWAMKSLDLDVDAARRAGEASGEVRGEVRGEAKGRAKMLLRQLGKKFGEVPAAVADLVQAAEIDQLDDWSDRILDAGSLDEVFAVDPTQ